MEVFSAAALVALLKKLVDLLRQLRGGDYNGVLTQLFVFAGGIGLIWLAAASPLMGGVAVGGVTISDFDWAAKVLAGLALGASASAYILDTQKAVDNTQSAALPALFSPPVSEGEPVLPDNAPAAPAAEVAVPGPQPVTLPKKPRKPRAKKAVVADNKA